MAWIVLVDHTHPVSYSVDKAVGLLYMILKFFEGMRSMTIHIDLDTLCKKIESAIPTAKATIDRNTNQIIVTFNNRPDVEVALLTPWYQMQIKKGMLKEEDLSDLLYSIRSISLN